MMRCSTRRRKWSLERKEHKSPLMFTEERTLDFLATIRMQREGASEAEAIAAEVDIEAALKSTELMMRVSQLSSKKTDIKTTFLQEDREAVSEELLVVTSEAEKESQEVVMMPMAKAAEDVETEVAAVIGPGLLKSTETEAKLEKLKLKPLQSQMRHLLRFQRSNEALSINWQPMISHS